jgi:hypothetical protein
MSSSLWSSGWIVVLDFILTPHAEYSLLQPVIFPFLDILSRFFGYEVTSKAFFLLVIWSAGYLGILFGRSISKNSSLSIQYVWIIESAGLIFLVINPYAYERMMVQPTIYMGTIALGFLIYHLFLSEKKYKNISAGIMGGIALIMMPHASYMLALIVWLFIVFYIRSIRDVSRIILTTSIIFLLNLNWLLAPFFWYGNSTTSISTFWPGNLEAFRTQALAPLDVWWTNILLYGFWGEQFSSHFARVDILSSLWYVAGFCILGIVIYGYFRWYCDGHKKEVTSLALLAFLSLIFGIGIASSLTEWLTKWMIEYIPLWQWYREPQKWIGLVMLVQGIGFILWVTYIIQATQKDKVVLYSVITSILILLITWSPWSLMWYHGQLRTTVYPSEFEEVRSELGAQPWVKVLALPWHSYIGCGWMGRPVVANPIKWLLSPIQVVSSDNIEVTNILYSNSSSPESKAVELFLWNPSHDFSMLKTHYNFTHVLLMKQCANSESFGWLDSLFTCKKQSDSSVHSLYRCWE